MKQDLGLEELKLLRADGGASKNDLLMQLQADFLQVSIINAGRAHGFMHVPRMQKHALPQWACGARQRAPWLL